MSNTSLVKRVRDVSMKKCLKAHLIVTIAVVLQIGHCGHDENPKNYEDHVERIMKEKNLRQPHEVKFKYRESHVESESQRKSVSFYIVDVIEDLRLLLAFI